MPSDIEGNIKYRIASEADYAKMANFYFEVFLKGISIFYRFSKQFYVPINWKYFQPVKNCFPDEPATQSRGGYLTRPAGLVDLLYSILQQNISVVAENEDDKIVGMSTHFIFQKWSTFQHINLDLNTRIFAGDLWNLLKLFSIIVGLCR